LGRYVFVDLEKEKASDVCRHVKYWKIKKEHTMLTYLLTYTKHVAKMGRHNVDKL
jgi:hypothetical protein